MTKFGFLISICLLGSIFVETSSLFAQEATVKSVRKKKRVVTIDQGSNGGFKSKTKVCVFDTSDKKITCSKIGRARKDTAFFRIKSAKEFAKIKKGMTVKIEGTGSTLTSSFNKKEVAVDQPKGRSNLKLGYVITPVAPSNFSKLTYNPPFIETPGAEGQPSSYKDAETVDTLWESTGTNSSSLLGIGAEFEYAFSQSFSLTTGLRYRFYKDFLAKTDYSMVDSSQYLELTQKASAVGLYFDFQFLNLELGTSTFLRMSSGLDYDMATMTLVADHKVDSDSSAQSLGQIYKATSKLSTISLRLGSSLNLLFLDPLGFYMGFNLLVPITASGGSPAVDIADPYQNRVPNAEEDFKTALAHKKSSFGAEIFLGGAISF